MSGVAISEAIVAIENSAKYVFKVITSQAMGGRGIYPVSLKNPVNPVPLRSTLLALPVDFVSKSMWPAGAMDLSSLPKSPQPHPQHLHDAHARIDHAARQCR